VLSGKLALFPTTFQETMICVRLKEARRAGVESCLFAWLMGAIHEVVVGRILERLPYKDCT